MRTPPDWLRRQDANESLSRFGHGREARLQRAVARDSAIRAEQLTQQRYRAGTASLIDELDTERQRVQAEDEWARAQGELMVAYATLQKSLGLGWSAEGPVKVAAAKSALANQG